MTTFNFEEIIAKIKDIASTGTPESAVVKKFQEALQNRYGKSDDFSIVMTAPNYADLWYLYNHVNMMTYVEAGDTESFFTDRLSFFKDKLGGMRPMRGLTPPTGEITYVWLTTEIQDIQTWLQKAKPWIQLMAFELIFKDQKFRYSTELKPPADAIGYILFPVGQPGIMEIISLIRESEVEKDSFSMQSDEKPTITSGEAFPPTVGWLPNKCYGRHLIEKLFVIPDAEKEKVFSEPQNKISFSTEEIDQWHPDYIKATNVKIPTPIEAVYGQGKDKDGNNVPGATGKSVAPKGWMRVWITRGEKWPVPGEFIGIICKPVVVPPHIWWNQESSPFVYAGNWFDTWDLTSGVIKEVIVDQEHPTTGASCTKYKIRFHGRECYIYSSDFLVYEVNDRVGLVKLGKHLTEGAFAEDSFDMVYQQYYGDLATDEVSTDYMIIPITYFQ